MPRGNGLGGGGGIQKLKFDKESLKLNRNFQGNGREWLFSETMHCHLKFVSLSR